MTSKLNLILLRRLGERIFFKSVRLLAQTLVAIAIARGNAAATPVGIANPAMDLIGELTAKNRAVFYIYMRTLIPASIMGSVLAFSPAVLS